MCLGTVIQVWGIRVSLSCPDIGSLESRKITDKKPTDPACTQGSPGQCSCHGKCLRTTEYCISPDSSLLLLCSSALWGDHVASKVEKFSTCLAPLGSAEEQKAPHPCFLACWDRSTVWQKWVKRSRHHRSENWIEWTLLMCCSMNTCKLKHPPP